MDQEIEDIILGHEERRPEGSLNRRIAAALSEARGYPHPAYRPAGMDEKQPSTEAIEAAKDWIADRLQFAMDDYSKAVNEVALALGAFAARSRWQPIETSKLGEMVWLYNRVWRHAFPGQRTGDRGEVYIDTCEPDAQGWSTHATHWQPLPEPPSCP